MKRNPVPRTAALISCLRPNALRLLQIWMRSLGLLPKRGGGAGAAKKPPASKPQTTADAVPAAAAAAGGGSVSAQANGHKAAAAAEEAGGAGGEGAAGRGMSPRSGEGGEEAEGRRAIAAAALAAARDAVAAGGRINKVVVKKVRRFAGKDVEVRGDEMAKPANGCMPPAKRGYVLAWCPCCRCFKYAVRACTEPFVPLL